MKNDRQSLGRFLERYRENSHAVVEATRNWMVMYDWLDDICNDGKHVDLRRELVELNEQFARGETTDRQNRDPAGDNDRDDGKQRWNDAVARHGFTVADAANKVLVEIEQSRDAIGRAETGDQGPDKMRALRQELDTQLIKAAELGAAGNGLIREVADLDEELKATVQAVERQRLMVEREKAPTRSLLSEAPRDPERAAPGRGETGDIEVRIRSVKSKANERDVYASRRWRYYKG